MSKLLPPGPGRPLSRILRFSPRSGKARRGPSWALLLLALTMIPLSHARADDVDDAAGLGDTKGDQAAQNNGKTKIIYRKKTAVSFDDAVVEGTTNNPEGVYVVTPPPTTFGSLLKLRPNFHRELMRDALLLK